MAEMRRLRRASILRRFSSLSRTVEPSSESTMISAPLDRHAWARGDQPKTVNPGRAQACQPWELPRSSVRYRGSRAALAVPELKQ